MSKPNPNKIITTITAITWLMSAKSLPIINTCPNPFVADIISPAIKALHAKDQPCFIPEINAGSAEGNTTFQYSFHPLAPIVLPAFIYKGSTLLIPDSVAIEIANIEPMAITNIIALSFNPYQSTAKGSQQILGNVCSPNIRERILSFRYLNLTINRPIPTPKTKEIKYPIVNLFKLATMAIPRVLSAIKSHNVENTSIGDGKV